MIPTDPRTERAAKVRPLVAYALVAALCAVIVLTTLTTRGVIVHSVGEPPQASKPATVYFGSRLVGRAGDALGRSAAPSIPTGPLASLVAGHRVALVAAAPAYPRARPQQQHHHAVRPHPGHQVLAAAPVHHAHAVVHHAAPQPDGVPRLDPQVALQRVTHHVKVTTTKTHHLVRNLVAQTHRTLHVVAARTRKLIRSVRLPHVTLGLLHKPAKTTV